jgi:hypothetical protein
MSAAELILRQREEMIQQELATLNLLYRTALATVEAELDQIEAMRVSDEEKQKMQDRCKYHLWLAKLAILPEHATIPRHKTALVAFHNQLCECLKKYVVAEVRGQFYKTNDV